MTENRLYEAAARGEEKALQQLLEQDPLLLDRVSNARSNKTPLHVATIQGQLAAVRVILKHNPLLAQELDFQQMSALHVASSKGYLEIARELLSAAPDMCLSRDCQGRNPLHLAAMKGHVEVLDELVRVYPMAAHMKLDRGMTVLHLCVVYRQTETLKMLVHNFDEMVNAKDDNGETVLHIAVRGRQVETVKYLLSMSSLEVHGLNLNGMKALDILDRSKRDARDTEIKESLKDAMKANDDVDPNHHYKWLDKKKDSLMVAASLIATMAFQVGVNPPGGVWQDDKDGHTAGFSILEQNIGDGYTVFYFTNTLSFIASLSIILLLMSGLPLRRRIFMWLLMLITWVAITAIAVVYILTLTNLSSGEFRIVSVTLLGIFTWMGLMALLVIINTARLILNLRGRWRKRKRNRWMVSRLV